MSGLALAEGLEAGYISAHHAEGPSVISKSVPGEVKSQQSSLPGRGFGWALVPMAQCRRVGPACASPEHARLASG